MQGRTSYKPLLQAIDSATAQDALAASKHKGKLDVSKVAVAGQSCGGLQALETSFDPRVTTTLVCNSGVLNISTGHPVMPVNITKEALSDLRNPMFYMIGGLSDGAFLCSA